MSTRVYHTSSHIDKEKHRIGTLVTTSAQEAPVIYPGEEWAFLFWGLGGGSSDLSFPVAVAIATVDRRAGAMANPLHSSLFGSDIKGAGGTHQHPPRVDARILAFLHRGTHPCRRSETHRTACVVGGVEWETRTYPCHTFDVFHVHWSE